MPVPPGSMRRTLTPWDCSPCRIEYSALLETLTGSYQYANHKGAFKIPYVYDYITELCRTQAEVTLNQINSNVHGAGQGDARHRMYKRLTNCTVKWLHMLRHNLLQNPALTETLCISCIIVNYVMQWQILHRAHDDLNAVIERMYSSWNYCTTDVAPTYKDRSLP
jgi:hypothetical protein